MLTERNQPWGLWATIGFSLLIFLGFLIGQLVGLLLNALIASEATTFSQAFDYAVINTESGNSVAYSFIPGAIIGILLTILFIKLRKAPSLSVTEYLHINTVSPKSVLLWVAILFLFSIGTELLNHLLERDIPAWMTSVYEQADNLILLWITLVIAAPLFEEILFRGFLFEGLRHTRIGNAGTVVITAAIWAVIHLQYELFDVTIIFLIGIILGYARLHTNSLITPIILHALMNLAATLQMHYVYSSQAV